jgi:hypothetical protein
MAPLPSRAEAMIDNGQSHADVLRAGNGQQGFRRADGNTGEIVAEIARHLVGEQHRRAVLMGHERVMRTRFDTVAALRTTLEEERFTDGARGTQPIRSERRSRLLRGRIHMSGIFLCRFRD